MSPFFSPSFAKLIPVGSDRVLVNASLVAKVDFLIKINSHKSEWKLELNRIKKYEQSRLDDKDLSEEHKRNALIDVGVLDKEGKIKNKSKIMDAIKLIASSCDEYLKKWWNYFKLIIMISSLQSPIFVVCLYYYRIHSFLWTFSFYCLISVRQLKVIWRYVMVILHVLTMSAAKPKFEIFPG